MSTRRSRRWAVALLLIVCLGLGWWLGARHPAPSPAVSVPAQAQRQERAEQSRPREVDSLSPKQTVSFIHADRYRELVRAANAGDADAAYQLAKGREACLDIQDLPARRDDERAAQPNTSSTPEEIKKHENTLADFETRIATARENCIGDEHAGFNEIHDLLARAAALGSPSAQYDYATNPWLNPMNIVGRLDDWRDWRNHAPGYLDSALRAGDARAALVSALASDTSNCTIDFGDPEDDPCVSSNLIGMIVPKDPSIAYRYYLLDQLMGDTAQEDWVDRELQELGSGLSPQQIADARAQSEQIYAQIQARHH